MNSSYESMVQGLKPQPSSKLNLHFATVMLTRHLAQNSKLLERFHQSHLQAEAVSCSSDSSTPAPCLEIPRLSAAEVSPERFKELFNFPFPLVIENFAGDSEAVQTWTPEYFREKYGNIQVPYFQGKDYWNVELCSLAELIDDILAGGKSQKYVNNIADIFHQIPGLQDALPIQKFVEHMGNRKHNKTQIFLGGSETGTGLHCANKFNLFVMVYGQKRWTFVHPKHSPWLYPISQKNFQFVYAPISATFGYDAQQYPLIQHVPRYTTVLNPGDVLVNPPWWWHAVENLTPASIGVATRWMTAWESVDGWKTNPIFSALEKLSLHYWKFAVKYYLLGIERRDTDGRLAH